MAFNGNTILTALLGVSETKKPSLHKVLRSSSIKSMILSLYLYTLPIFLMALVLSSQRLPQINLNFIADPIADPS